MIADPIKVRRVDFSPDELVGGDGAPDGRREGLLLDSLRADLQQGRTESYGGYHP